MKYKYKLEINENGTWQDYTAHCIQPFSLKDTLDETLATMTVKMYLDRAETLTPSTKARFSIYEKSGADFVLKDTYDFIVDTDNAYKEVLSGDGWWAHELVFTEPIALLQKYTVDNISMTYQLDDVVQYLDTGALKFPISPIMTKVTTGQNVRDYSNYGNATWVHNEYYSYEFDTGEYTDKYMTKDDGEEEYTFKKHIGLCEWSKQIYFKTKNGTRRLYRINAAGDEIVCGSSTRPFIPFAPLYCNVYNASTEESGRFQLAYDVYVEEINLTTGETVLYNGQKERRYTFSCDEMYWSDAAHCQFIAPYVIDGKSMTEAPFMSNFVLSADDEPEHMNELGYCDQRESYRNEKGEQKYYWFQVQPNRRYKMRYVRNRNFDRFGAIPGSLGRHFVAHGLPTNGSYAKIGDNYVGIPIGDDNPLQFPEMRYYFDVLDGDAYMSNETIDVVKPTPAEYRLKYNCYDYLLKAFYASGSYKKGDALPFAMTNDIETRLRRTPIYESVNQGATLYDICLYIGRYIHSIPYCYFGSRDIIYLDFLQLGQNNETPDDGRITSLYNSRNLAEYLSSFDSYVSNLVNNDSDVEEVICAKSADGSSLISADNAVLLLSRPCYGIKSLYVAKRNSNGSLSMWRNISQNICEKSIYNILDFRAEYSPNRGSCIYYTYGGTKIEGLQYKRPNPVSAGEENTAIQNIIMPFAIYYNSSKNTYDVDYSQLNINNYVFKIRYRTYDDTRVRIYRPDLKKYMLNTPNDRYPMQRTFRSQTEKVVNSDFYGRNLTGELIRTGNEVKQRDYIVESYDEIPKCGQLRSIDGVPHYVSEVIIPFYNEYISASVIYSKDFQRLSSIVSIPAENRFYEIAAQGIIKRTVANDEFVIIDTVQHPQDTELRAVGRAAMLSRIMTNTPTAIRYAVVKFKNAQENVHPLTIDILKPVHTFSMHGSYGMSIEMEDNYSAGTQVRPNGGFNFKNANNIAGAFNTIGSDIAAEYAQVLVNADINAYENAYRELAQVRYCDKFGNVDLYDIKLYGEQNLTASQAALQPQYLGGFSDAMILYESVNNELRKDNREAIAIAPQFNAIAGRDSIIIGSAFWKIKNAPVKCYAYTGALNKNDETLPNGGIEIGYELHNNAERIELRSVPHDATAIAFGCENATGDRELIFGINERVNEIIFSFAKTLHG